MKSYRFSWRARFNKFFLAKCWPGLLRLARPALWLKRRLRPQRIEAARFTGKMRGGDGGIEVLSGVTAQTWHHLQQLLFDSPPSETIKLGHPKLLDLFRSPRRLAPAADIALLPANEGQHEWLDDGSWFSIPEWVRGHVSLPLDEKVHRNDSIRSNRRLIRRYDYGYIVTRDEKLFEEFYYRMLEPYARANFGEGVCLDSYAHKRTNCEEFDLMLLQKNTEPGKYLAGFLIIYEPGAARLWSLGVRDGDHSLVREGVLAALYNFSFDYLAEKGHKLVNLGGSRPFLNDGILRFKRRYGQRLTACQWEGFGLKILRLTPTVKSFLRQNPFVFRSKGKLYGAVFADAPLTGKAIVELYERYFYTGTERLLIWVFQAEADESLPMLPPELDGKVEIRPASQLLASKLHLP